MLSRLSIRDIVLIERLDIDYAAGLAVLTGETGAGKSILLDAFALALGSRGDASLVRQGAEQGQVTAAFDVEASHPALALLAENGIGAEDGADPAPRAACRRAHARLRQRPAGERAGAKALGSALVEIHGQHDERALVDVSTHRRLLDAYAGLEDDAAAVARAWSARRSAEEAVTAHRARVEQARREADWLRHAVEELTRLKPEAGEESALAEKRAAMMAVDKVAEDLRDAHEAVAGERSPIAALSAALRRLERRAAQAPALIDPAVKSLDAALTALDETRTQLDAALRAANHDPNELDRIEERLFALRAAGRKYNVAVDNLAALAAKHAADLAALDAGAERAEAARSGRARGRGRLCEGRGGSVGGAQEGGRQARQGRHRGAEAAQARARAVFDQHRGGRRRADGIDRVEFWVQTNPGTRPGPLMKVASGGELARFLLALKVVLADRGSAPTLVFDEIDTGAGGAVADAIGAAPRAARREGAGHRGDPCAAGRGARRQAYLITKDALPRGKRVATSVSELASDRRREEIARMLAGAEITDEARKPRRSG